MRRHRGWRVLVAPALCVLAAVLAVILARPGGRSASTEQGADGAVDGVSVWPDRAREALEQVFAQDGSAESSLETFLDDMEHEVEHGRVDGGATGVFWTEDCALPAAAERLLRTYQQVGDVDLVTAGYLDLQGNVWGALVRYEDGWVDLLAVSTTDDVTSEVRVVRLTPERDGV